MTVADTSALIAILRQEPERELFQRLIGSSARCLISAVSMMETSIVLAGRTGDRTFWTELDELVCDPGIEVVAHDAGLAAIARDAFLAFGKGRHPAALNLADCASYALAKSRGAPLLFKGGDFAKTDLPAAA